MPDLDVVSARYAAKQKSLNDQLLRALILLWSPFLWWRTPDMISAWAAQSAVQVDAAQSAQRRLTRTYMQMLLREGEALPRSLPAVEDGVYSRSGIGIVEVYERPARQRFYVETLPPETRKLRPDQAFLERLTSIVSADLATVARDETTSILEASTKVLGMRRIIHPELSRTGTCGLCIVAADRIYRIGELLPLHGECHCTSAIITEAGGDPGLVLNRLDLEQLYSAAGSNLAEDLARIRVTTVEHGELGPILVREGQNFLDVEQVNARGSRKQATPYVRPTREQSIAEWSAMLDRAERSLARLRKAQAGGSNLVTMGDGAEAVATEGIARAIQYQLNLIAKAKSYTR